MFDAAAVADHVAEVRARIAAAGGREVELVAVTKTFPVEAIRAAVAAGCTAIGENYAQELVAKVAALTAAGCAEGERPEVHFIGHVQTNKVRMLAPVVTVWETVDRAAIVDEIAKRAPGARVFVQVNVSGEQQKHGCRPDEAAALVRRAGRRRAPRRGAHDHRRDGRSGTRRGRASARSARWRRRSGCTAVRWG